MKVNKHLFENGFSVITAEDRSNKIISIQLYVNIGSSRELENQAGFSHFTEHLVFKSTKNYPENSLMDRVTFLGGSINAYTEFDTTCFYITLPSKFTKEAIILLSEIARYANWSDEEFISEKMVVIEELKQYQDDPEDFFVEEIAKTYFKKNNYRKPIIGDIETLRNCKPKDLKHFYSEYYSPLNCFMVASGDFDEAEIIGLVDAEFSDWEKKKVEKLPIMKEDFPNIPEVICFDKKISSDILAFVLPDLSENDPETYPLSLAGKAFGIGKNSRLFHRLFEVEKLIDTIKAHSLSGLNDGITIYLIMPKSGADLNKIVDIFLEELELIYNYGLSEIEIADHKKELSHYYRYSYEYVESLATALGNEEILSDYRRFFNYPNFVEAINKKNVDETIKRYFKKDSLFIYHIGNGKFDKNAILKKLLSKKNKIGKKFKDTDFHQTKLSNGMNIIMKRVKGKPTVGVSLSVNVSQLNETAKNLGTNLMTSSLLLYGNENRNYKQLMNFCISNGINLGISPSIETTNIKLKCFTEMLPISLETIAEIIQKPLFPKHHFENLRNTYSSNIDRIKDFPHYYASHLWANMFFGKNSNMLSREGTKTSLRMLSRKKLINWYEEHYIPNNMSLAIVGDFNFEETLANCEHLFSKQKSKDYLSVQNPIIVPSKNRFKRTSQGLNQAHISLGGWGCNLDDHNKSTGFHVLAQIIGGDTNSILFQELREKRGLSYSSHFNYSSMLKGGYYSLSALVDKARENEASDLIFEILDDVKKNGITENDLQKTKNYIRGQRLSDEESVLSQAQTIAVLDAIGLGYDFYLNRENRLRSTNVENVSELAHDYFDRDNYYIHILD